MRALGIVFLAVGILLIAVAIVYWAVPAGHLPAFMGHAAGSIKHHSKRAIAAAVLGVLCLIGGVAFTRMTPASND
jgi:hypothetical protein